MSKLCKYIRTKDGIIEVIRVCQIDEIKEYICKGKHNYGSEQVIKEADKLEDLFDEYILENKDHTYQSLLVNSDPYDKISDKLPFSDRFTKDVKNGWLSYCSSYLQRGYRIYGAIIVRGTHGEPILQPVSVMNNKGEWKLL